MPCQTKEIPTSFRIKTVYYLDPTNSSTGIDGFACRLELHECSVQLLHCPELMEDSGEVLTLKWDSFETQLKADSGIRMRGPLTCTKSLVRSRVATSEIQHRKHGLRSFLRSLSPPTSPSSAPESFHFSFRLSETLNHAIPPAMGPICRDQEATENLGIAQALAGTSEKQPSFLTNFV